MLVDLPADVDPRSIVAQSRPEDEYRETLIKARKIFESFSTEEQAQPGRRERAA